MAWKFDAMEKPHEHTWYPLAWHKITSPKSARGTGLKYDFSQDFPCSTRLFHAIDRLWRGKLLRLFSSLPALSCLAYLETILCVLPLIQDHHLCHLGDAILIRNSVWLQDSPSTVNSLFGNPFTWVDYWQHGVYLLSSSINSLTWNVARCRQHLPPCAYLSATTLGPSAPCSAFEC